MRTPAPIPSPVTVILLLSIGLSLSACAPKPDASLTLTGHTMGTSYHIELARPPHDLDRDALQHAIEARLAAIERQMSTYDPASELSRFNRQSSTTWFPVSPNVVEVVQAAQDISRFSAGRFDVTVGPLVDAWGFGPEKTAAAPPDAAQIERARARVGYAKLHVRADPPALRKTAPGLRADLSAIAKGYGVDALSRLLREHGAHHHLVEIGGELRGAGRNAHNRPWRIGVETPGPGFETAYAAVRLGEQGIATSGDYRNFFEHQGRRYTHVVDPVSGQTLTHRLTSVTVVAASCMRADALATALLASGPEHGYRLAERAGIAALFIIRTETGFRDRATPPMRALMSEVPGDAARP